MISGTKRSETRTVGLRPLAGFTNHFFIEPASVNRRWMNDTAFKFAKRCLPLLIANQSGWLVKIRHPLSVMWEGTSDPNSLFINWGRGGCPNIIKHDWGEGIFSIHVPAVVEELPTGYSLQLRGPTNWPIDGLYPLETTVQASRGVELTVFWKVVCPKVWIVLNTGAPVSMIVPQETDLPQSFTPCVEDLPAEPALYKPFQNFAREREAFSRARTNVDKSVDLKTWQGDYFRGKFPDGTKAAQHQTRLQLRHFTEDEP